MATDPQLVRRMSKLLVLNNKFDVVEDCLQRMVHQSLVVHNKINNLSDRETADAVLAMAAENKMDSVANGLICLLLTGEEPVQKIMQLLSLLGDWIPSLCVVNMVIIEGYPKMQEYCKDNLIHFFREAMKMNVPKLENVMMHQLRVFNGTGDWNSKIRLSMMLSKVFLDNEQWLMSLKNGSYFFSVVLSTFGRLISDMMSPQLEPVRTSLINVFVFIMRSRPTESLLLGRDLILILMRLSKIPQFEAIWKDLANSPDKFNITKLEDLMFRADQMYHNTLRLSPELIKKIDFLIFNVKNPQDKHFEWLTMSHLSGPDAGSLRAEMVRYIIYFNRDNSVPPNWQENRVILLNFLLNGAQSGQELQWLKTVFWIDWLLFDSSSSQVSPITITTTTATMDLVRYLINVQPVKANSLVEYCCKSVHSLYPPSKDRIRVAVNMAMKCVADQYMQQNFHLTNILENVRLDKSIREMIRDIWKDFVRPQPAVLPPPPLPDLKTGPPPSSNNNSTNNNDVKKRKEKEKEKEKEKDEPPETEVTRDKKSPSPPSTLHSRTVNKEEIEKEVESNYQMLRDDIKPIVAKLREAFQSQDSDDSEKGEAVERLLKRLFENDDRIEEDQLEYIGQCLHGLMGRTVEYGKSFYPENPTEEAFQECFTHPLFIIFRNLCFTPITDIATRAPMVTIIASMRDRDSTITYLLLYFMKVGLASPYIETYRCYEEVARACGKEMGEMLAEDLQQCALDDDKLFGYLTPYVCEQFGTITSASIEVFNTICSYVDSRQLMDLVGASVRDTVQLFRKDTFASIVTASFEWPTTAQWVFWQLVHAEGVPIDWVLSVLPKFDGIQNGEATTNLLIMLKRIDREPTTALIRQILSRTPVIEDTFAVNCIKILVDDGDMCSRVADILAGILKKQIQSGDFVMNKGSTKKGPHKLSMEQVFCHLEHFIQLCLTREKRVAESLLSKYAIVEAFNAIKACDKTSFLRTKYTQVCAVVDILSDDCPQSSRTLRGNRGNAPARSSKKREEEEETASPSKRKKQRIVQIDSDSD